MIDFDEIDVWAPLLTEALEEHAPQHVREKLHAAPIEFVEDARDLLFTLVDRDLLIDATLEWIQGTELAGYHGTRLTDAELTSILADGLIPLKAEMRRDRLVRALSPHPLWNSVAEQLDSVIRSHGQGAAVGKREGQVHLTLSKGALTTGFNHYLTHGSEFDLCVARALLGIEGLDLMKRDGRPTVIQVAVPGRQALEAAHPFFDIADMRARGDVPNIINEFLEAWSFRFVHASFETRTLRTDCGMIFWSTVPASWILGCETLTESDLEDRLQ